VEPRRRRTEADAIRADQTRIPVRAEHGGRGVTGEEARAAISEGTRTASARTRGDARPAPTRYAIVGSGWRSSVYLRLAYLLPDAFSISLDKAEDVPMRCSAIDLFN